MLWHCLEHISACDHPPITVFADWHVDKPAPPIAEITEVCNRFSVAVEVREPHSYIGNSFNVLTAYKESADFDLVYIIEDDVMITPDFFDWHREQQEQKPFCSVGCRNTRSGKLKSYDDYASLGVCLSRESIAEISKHACHEYFSDMSGYCTRFGPSKEFTEQDGLILRIMASVGGFSLWPEEPKAIHVGYYGYHRPANRPHGSLGQRYLKVKRRMTQGHIT